MATTTENQYITNYHIAINTLNKQIGILSPHLAEEKVTKMSNLVEEAIDITDEYHWVLAELEDCLPTFHDVDDVEALDTGQYDAPDFMWHLLQYAKDQLSWYAFTAKDEGLDLDPAA